MGHIETNGRVKYSDSHTWVRFDGGLAIIGVSNYAQKELGDVVYVELPQEGAKLQAGEVACVIESTKAAVDIYTPISGRVIEVNMSLQEYPERINLSAEKEGWLFKLEIQDSALAKKEWDVLYDETAYKQHLK